MGRAPTRERPRRHVGRWHGTAYGERPVCLQATEECSERLDANKRVVVRHDVPVDVRMVPVVGGRQRCRDATRERRHTSQVCHHIAIGGLRCAPRRQNGSYLVASPPTASLGAVSSCTVDRLMSAVTTTSSSVWLTPARSLTGASVAITR
eukprot:6959062-Prymnesium_polylepis.2